MTVIGRVDTVFDGVVDGWAADPDTPDVPVALDVCFGGILIDRILAYAFRPDLLMQGMGRGRHGFSYKSHGMNAQMLAFRAPGCLALQGSWQPAKLNGRIDRIHRGLIEGWLIDASAPDVPLEVEVLVNGLTVGRMLARMPRPDIALQFGGLGLAGYAIRIPEWIGDQSVIVREALSGRVLSPGLKVPEATGVTIAVKLPAAADIPGSFDQLIGNFAEGWAVGSPAGEPAEVEFTMPDGQVVGSAIAQNYRGDLERAGYGDGYASFRAELALPPPSETPVMISARLKHTRQELNNSPLPYQQSRMISKWLTRSTRAVGRVRDRLEKIAARQAGGLAVSIIMPVYNTPEAWLREALESVLAQWCGAWELICVDDGSTDDHVPDTLAEYEARDKRIRVTRGPFNQGVARAVNVGIKIARHPYVTVMDHDDALEPDAVSALLAGAQTGAELIYTDEIITGEKLSTLIELRARPSFSYDYYLSHPYFVHMVCVQRQLALEIGGWDESLGISWDVDYVLRVLERAQYVTHVAAPVYRWRTHSASTGHALKGGVPAATAFALNRHLAVVAPGAVASPAPNFNFFRVAWPDDPAEKTLVVIPTRNRPDLLGACLESLQRTVNPSELRIAVIDHNPDDPTAVPRTLQGWPGSCVVPWSGNFNYAAMNNAAVEQHGAGCRFVLFLNDDVEAREIGWFESMRSVAARGDVGAVGAILLYPDNTIQHAGVIIGMNGSAEHAHNKLPLFQQYDEEGKILVGYNGSIGSRRDWSAVTAACMMSRLEVFSSISGFDERYAIGFNDTDYCLRLREAGWRVLCNPVSVLLHRESTTRAGLRSLAHPDDTLRFIARWGIKARGGDPCYSPLLTHSGRDHTVGDRVGEGPMVRVTKVRRPGSGDPPTIPSHPLRVAVI